MARIRSVKPTFFTSEDASRVSALARLLFIGLWTEADRDGRLSYRPRQLRARLFPYDDHMTVADIESLVDELDAAGLIVIYDGTNEDGPCRLICIPTWHDHQRPHPKEPPSTLPAPADGGIKRVTREALTYFIHDPGRAAIKIGVSTNPSHRLSSLQTASASRLTLLGSAPGGFLLERSLHTKLAKWRRFGEWFDDCPEVRSAIHESCMADASGNHPGEYPSSPVGREGKVLGREGSGNDGARSIAIGVGPPPRGRALPLIRRRDPSAFWEGPLFDVPGKWAAKAVRAGNGAVLESDVAAFARDLTAKLERTGDEVPAGKLLAWLDDEWSVWRSSRTDDRKAQQAIDRTKQILAEQDAARAAADAAWADANG